MSVIEFFCAVCGQSLEVSGGLAGGVCKCPACTRVIPVPPVASLGAAAVEWPKSPAGPIVGLEIKFLCPACRARLMTDARSGGQPVSCPKCGAGLAIPRLPDPVVIAAGAAPSPPPGASGAQPVPIPVARRSKREPASGAPPPPSVLLSPEEIAVLSGQRP
jgi:hypothetical protein